MSLKRAMRLSRLTERENAGDVNVRWVRADHSIELLNRVCVRNAVITLDRNSLPRLWLRLHAIRICHAASIAHCFQRLGKTASICGHQRGVDATRRKGASRRCNLAFASLTVH